MASLRADDDPQASEYAGKDSPDDSDNDEGLYVETSANVTKLLTTQGTHNLDTMKHMLHTIRTRYVRNMRLDYFLRKSMNDSHLL